MFFALLKTKKGNTHDRRLSFPKLNDHVLNYYQNFIWKQNHSIKFYFVLSLYKFFIYKSYSIVNFIKSIFILLLRFISFLYVN